MITFEDFDALAVEVAELLTGRAVVIRWRPPALIGKIGAVSKFFGKYVIEISPELELDQALKTLLHEVAHIHLHSDQIPASRAAFIPSGSRVGDCVKDPKYYAMEIEANELAAYWLDQAEQATYMLTPYRLLEALKKLYSQ